MNYIVIDLEYNQNFDFKVRNRAPSDPLLPLEVIQIGAVKLAGNMSVSGSFSTLVKPTLYPRLNPFVSKVTGLKTADLGKAPCFPDGYRNLMSFIGRRKTVLCFWGNDDMKHLCRNALYYQLNLDIMPLRYINIQKMVSLHLKMPPKKQLSLKTVVDKFGLTPDLPFHSAVNDAHYTARIFKHIYNPNKSANELDIMTFDLENFVDCMKDSKARNGI